MRAIALSLSLALTASCGGARPAAPPPEPVVPAPPPARVVSWDLLAREPVANSAEVRHILIGWRDLAEAYGGGIDERAAARTQAQAEEVVDAVLARIKEGADFQALMAEYSEDGGSAATGRSYHAAPDSELVIEFRQMSLRLEPGEVGVCQSRFGFHIITRVE